MKMSLIFRILLISLTIASTISFGPGVQAKISSTVIKPTPKETVESPAQENGQESKTSKAHRGFQLLVLLKMLK